MQECKYQPCRMFIENTLAVEMTMMSVNLELNNMIKYSSNSNHWV